MNMATHDNVLERKTVSKVLLKVVFLFYNFELAKIRKKVFFYGILKKLVIFHVMPSGKQVNFYPLNCSYL